MLPSNSKEPIISNPKPEQPFQEMTADLCSYAAQDYLILLDGYSDWPDLIFMGHSTTMCMYHLTKALRHFAVQECLTSYGQI